MDIDYKKLLEQEPEFEEFFNDVIEEVTKNSQNEDSLKFMYSLYEIGMTPKQVAKMIRDMTK